MNATQLADQDRGIPYLVKKRKEAEETISLTEYGNIQTYGRTCVVCEGQSTYSDAYVCDHCSDERGACLYCGRDWNHEVPIPDTHGYGDGPDGYMIYKVCAKCYGSRERAHAAAVRQEIFTGNYGNGLPVPDDDD